MNKSNDSTNTNNKEVSEKIKNAYRKFLKNDSYLLTKKVSDLFILLLPTAFDVVGSFIFMGV